MNTHIDFFIGTEYVDRVLVVDHAFDNKGRHINAYDMGLMMSSLSGAT